MEFTGTCSALQSTISTMYYNRVTVTGLEINTAYTYQLGDGNGNWSPEYTTKTANPDSFSYLVFGDPQTASQTNGNNWKQTLDLALEANPNLAFMASTGDQVNDVTLPEYNYFFTPQQTFSSLPLASCMGNHETYPQTVVSLARALTSSIHPTRIVLRIIGTDTVPPCLWYGTPTSVPQQTCKPFCKLPLTLIQTQLGEFSISTLTYTAKVAHTPLRRQRL